MAEVYRNESNCVFYNTNGALVAGGCTKQWLDDNGGDPSALFNNMAGDDYSPIVNIFDATSMINSDIIVKIGTFGDVEAGMVACVYDPMYGPVRHAVIDSSADHIQLDGYSAGDNSSLVTCIVGGAFGIMQDALDESDAEHFDAWVFANSTLSGINHTLNSGDGDYLNNTKKYIVGYKINCYDGLPAGHGYFPEAIGDGQYYKTPLKRMQDGDITETELTADLCKISISTQDHNSFFNVEYTSENIVLMGFYFESYST